MHVIRLLNCNKGKSGSLAKAADIWESWEEMMKVTGSTASFGISLLDLLDSFDVGRLLPVQCSAVHIHT
jgi:hypothetical protein